MIVTERPKLSCQDKVGVLNFLYLFLITPTLNNITNISNGNTHIEREI